jgi:hypothetical protein
VHDTDTDVCAHLTVDFEPCAGAEGDVHAHWVCRDCELEFAPAQWAEGWHDAAQVLARAAATLFVQNQRMRAYLVMGGAFLAGSLVTLVVR